MANRSLIDVDVRVLENEIPNLLGAIEMTLMGYNLSVFFRRYMEPYMRERARRRFAQEGDDASGAWATLLEVTQDIREHFGFPREHPINRRTGELENFMLRGAIDQRWTPTSATMMYPGVPPRKSIREKLKTAQVGKEKPRTVARPVAAVSMVDMVYFMNSFVFWFGRESQAIFNSRVVR